MDGLMDFLRVFGALALSAAVVIAMAVIMTSVSVRMKRMEARMTEMEEFIKNALSGVRNESRADNAKQRRIMSENMANFSESMTRAILSLGDEEDAENKEK